MTCPARRLSHCCLFSCTIAPYDCALQPCWVCLVFCEQGHPAKKGRENYYLLLRLHYTIFSSPRLLRDGCLLLRLSLKRSEEGEREELITNRGLATVVFMLGLCQEVQTQRRGRENERFLTLSSRSKAERLVSTGFVKRVQTQAKKKKRVHESCYRHHPRHKQRRRCGFCCRAC